MQYGVEVESERVLLHSAVKYLHPPSPQGTISTSDHQIQRYSPRPPPMTMAGGRRLGGLLGPISITHIQRA